MRVIAFACCWCVAACTSSGAATIDTPILPPTVSSMTPTSGAYGTAIAITGSGFIGASVVFAGGGEYKSPPSAPWSDTQISIGVPFPAQGDVTVSNDAGEIVAGSFAATSPWIAGTGFELGPPLRARAIGTTVAMLASFKVNATITLAVFGGADAGSYPLDGLVSDDTDDDLHADLVADDAGLPEVLATKPDGTFVAITLGSAGAIVTPTGITGATLIVAGRDATGMYAWLLTAAGFERARGPAWTIDRGPLTAPDLPLAAEVAADGTVVIATAASSLCTSGEDPLSFCYSLTVSSLAPTATAFTSGEDANAPAAYDAITDAHLILAADGTHMVVTADEMLHGGYMSTAAERTAPGTWTPSPCVNGLCVYGDALEMVTSPDAGPALTADVDGASTTTQDLGAWPAIAQAVVVDASGALRPVFAVEATCWAPIATTP